jgi:membrane peptidoglycan carboxypeptidase
VVIVKRLARFVFVMVAITAVLAGSMALVGPKLAKLVSAHRSDHERISLKPLAERSLIYDAAGNLSGTLTNQNDYQNRSQISLKDVPETVIGSVLAAEDANFYKHKGVNVRSILRAVDANLESGQISQGGSTITQQVVKNSLVGSEQDFSRKLREAFLAVELEKQMSKDEILERYLNSIYFGGGAYGVKAASEYYFRKDVKDLNWAEGALLAALIRSPTAYDPFENQKLALERRAIVFQRLLATKRLTPKEVGLYTFVPLPTEPNRPTPPYDYFLEEVKQQLLHDDSFGLGATDAARAQTVFEGGIRVFTTFDPGMQGLAKQARDETLPNNRGDATFDVTNPKDGSLTFGTQAIVSVEPSTGAVRAMVGGPGFERWKFNLGTQRDPGRQPGSTMKAFVLATLFSKGYVPSDTVNGGPCAFKLPGVSELYKPSTGKAGFGTIQKMTQASSNCGFTRLGQLVGVDQVAEMASRLGIRSQLFLTDSEGNPTAPPASLPLGTMGVSPLDMASAYGVFANDGVRNEPYYVERIEDRNGKVLYQHQLKSERVIDPQVARLVNQVLVSNVTGGTGTRAKIDGGQVAAGKTGTTNFSTDVWFGGYTPQLATAIWMGAPEGSISLANAGLGGATGGRYPAATWGRYYSLLFANGRPQLPFLAPEPTRRGKWVGKIPNEVGGSTPSRQRSPNGTSTTTPGGDRGNPPATVPVTPGTTPATTPDTTPGFGGGP